MNPHTCTSTRNRIAARLFVLLGLLTPLTLLADPSRYVINGGEVYDKETDLTWQRCSVGLRWKDGRCIGVQKTFTWEQAQKQATKGWRVPSKDELMTLWVSEKVTYQVLPDLKIKNIMWFFLTSTPSDASEAWAVSFYDGRAVVGPRISHAAVRLVRTGK